MARADKLRRVMAIWDDERQKAGMRKGKYGQPRDKYLVTFFSEDLTDEGLHGAIRNFLADEWWCSEGKRFQDLEHFIRNYGRFLHDVYKHETDDIFFLERE